VAKATSRQAGCFAIRPQQADASTFGSAFGSIGRLERYSK